MPEKTSSQTVSEPEMAQAERDFEAQLKKLINGLKLLWQPHHKSSLDVRYETGRKLNALYGPPSRRLPYGAGTLKKVSDELGVSRSEISRMRQFAELIPDWEGSRSAIPNCNTWTKVKMHLATLTPHGISGSAKSTAASCLAVRRSIQRLTDKIKTVETPSDDNRRQMMADLKELDIVIRAAYGVSLQPETAYRNSPTGSQDEPGRCLGNTAV